MTIASKSPEDWRVPRDVAIPRLLEQHGGRLYGLARRLCGTHHEADDLLQETFLAAYRGWDGFEGRADPASWLWTIAAHACQRMHRKRAGEPERLESLEALAPFGQQEVGIAGSDGDGPTEAMRKEARELVGAAIAELPTDFRLPLVLRDIIGFSVAEVAAMLGLPEATVKTRVHRARLKLRGALESALPKRELPPPAYSEQVCFDLLTAKQESLDRGVPMPGGDQLICERCSAVFAQLDLAQDVCRELGEQEMPDTLRAVLRERLAAGH